MRHAFSQALIIGALLGTQPLSVALAESNEPAEQQARALWHQQIAAGYQALSTSAQRLSDTATRYCETPNDNTRQLLVSHWREAFFDWQAVRFVDFGPIELDSRAWQLQFWPDPKNLVGTKARQLLSSDTPIDRQRVTDSGVAAEGFPMLEYLLFDEPFNQTEQALPDGRGCALLLATATIVEDNTTQLATDWQALAEHYQATDSYSATTVRSAMTALDILVHKRLGEPMGLGSSQRRLVYAGDAWRSGQSIAAAEASLSGLQRYFLPGLIRKLEQADQRGIADDLTDQFQTTLARFDALPDDLASVLEDDQRYAQLQNLYIAVQQLEQTLELQAAVALGIRQGFNSNDGD
ncbi:imelysin family protein [Saccharospirillum impatiens]|uniref:imelysin family protein n=1 Tax=Saccharospirillum impatiens TaxID=169438 RepID=UPI000429647B|nr:imelysin family protein [Saccharospirillum impatiens]